MASTKRQLREVPPMARKVARLAGEVQSIGKRLEGLGIVNHPQLTGELASVATRLRNLISDLKTLENRSKLVYMVVEHDALVELEQEYIEDGALELAARVTADITTIEQDPLWPSRA